MLFHATLVEEEGLFNLADVAWNVHDKLVARHPHVFGDVTATTPGAVLANWERNKLAEKQRTHLFEGIPTAMPALARVAKAEHKLASQDLGWPDTGLDARSLVTALAAMLVLTDAETSIDPDTAAAVGSLLLEEARLVAHRGEDPEALVRQAFDRLGAHLAVAEAAARELGADLVSLDPAVRLELWRAANAAP